MQEFVLPLNKEQKEHICKVLQKKSKGQYIGSMLVEFIINIIPIFLAVGGIFWGKYYLVLIPVVSKVITYILYNYVFRADGTEMVYAKAYGYKCTIIDIDSIVLTEGAKRSDLTGERKESLLFVKDYVYYEVDGRKQIAKNPELIIGNTEKLVTEGNREHLAVLYGKNNNILIAASIIDKRYKNVTIGELKEIADLAAEKGIENVDIDEAINNTGFKKATCKGRILSRKEKRKLGFGIFKQFYVDYEGRSLKQELVRRFAKFGVAVVAAISIMQFVRSNSSLIIKVMDLANMKTAEYVFNALWIYMMINLVVYAGYVLFRNDVYKQLKNTKEPRVLHATMEYEGNEKKENVEHYKYKLLTENGDIIHNIYSRDDIYIHHKAQYGEVEVLVCDKMLAIYPKDYFAM